MGTVPFAKARRGRVSGCALLAVDDDWLLGSYRWLRLQREGRPFRTRSLFLSLPRVCRLACARRLHPGLGQEGRPFRAQEQSRDGKRAEKLGTILLGRRSWGQSSWEGLLVASELSWVESGRPRRARGAGAQMGGAPVGPRRSASDPVKLIRRRPRGEAPRTRSLPKREVGDSPFANGCSLLPIWAGSRADAPAVVAERGPRWGERLSGAAAQRAILSRGIGVGPEEKCGDLGPFPSPERASLPRIAQGEVGERLASRRSPGSLASAFVKS